MTRPCANLSELFLQREEYGSEKPAFAFLRDGEDDETSWTYGQLGTKARAVASALQAEGRGERRALLLYPPGLDFIAAFWGCLLAQVMAVPVYPPRSSHNLARLQTVLKDADPSLVLTSQAALDRMRPFIRDDALFSKLRFVPTDTLEDGLAASWKCPASRSGAIAFLQYTSGSTDSPKGVMVGHANVLANQAQIQRAFQQTEESLIVGWLPLYHDMGLIGNVIHPLYLGARCVLMPPLAFLQRPFRWLRTISRYRATTSGGPNFAYDLCTRRTTEEQLSTLDLSSWSVAFNGAEPVRARTIEQFSSKFKRARFDSRAFSPCYGLAEATLLVSGHKSGTGPNWLDLDANSLRQHRVRRSSSEPGAVRGMSCGRPAEGNSIAIVDPQSLRECPPGQIGEVWVSGPGVATGYWKREDESSSVFRAHIPGHNAAFLRTGDSGFLSDGELFIAGRLKDLIIVRGRNYWPQDIEATVEAAHPALRAGCGAAFSIEGDNGEEQLVIVYELERNQEKKTAGVLESVREAVVAQHEIQPFAIVLAAHGSVPKTSSGKVQRHQARNSFRAGTLAAIAKWRSDLSGNAALPFAPAGPMTAAEIDEWLINKIATATGRARGSIDLDHPLAGHIADSLAAVELSYAVEWEFGIIIPLSSVMGPGSGRQLAAELLAAQRADSSAPRGYQEDSQGTGPEEFPLSAGQKSLWFLHQLAPESPAYNLAFAARIPVAINVEVLRRGLEKLVHRHAALRTTFHTAQGELFQRVHHGAGMFFEEIDALEWGELEIKARLQQEFDTKFALDHAPLFRVVLLRRTPAGDLISLVLHHIVADLWSLAIFMRELMLLYAADSNGRSLALPGSGPAYYEYVQWQQQLLPSSKGEELCAYWMRQLAGELPVLNLPTDRPRPAVQTYKGASTPFSLNAELGHRIGSLARTCWATSYMVFMAVFQVLLCRYSDQQEIVIGSPTSGRTKRAFAGTFGYFVNTLAIRSRTTPDLTFIELLTQVRETVLQALDHQDYPFSALVERLQPGRDPSRSPLFQAMFTFQKTFSGEDEIFAFALGEPDIRLELQGLVFESVASQSRGALFDLMLVMAERQQMFSGFFQYNADLFDAETITRMVRHWHNLLGRISEAPETAIQDLSLLDAEERHQLLVEWNATETGYGPFASVAELIEYQAQRSPSKTCVLFEKQSLTYAELNQHANLLGHYLKSLGCGPDVPVGVCMERSLEMVVALLGIMKAGAAYVPLEPQYPAERLAYMLATTQTSVLLVQARIVGKFQSYRGRVLRIDTEWPLIEKLEKTSGNHLESKIRPENLAYVIFTSGSTGRPKGVMNTHKGLRNRLLWMQKVCKLDDTDVVLQKTPFGFDVSVWEFFLPLMAGARLVMARPDGHQDPAYLGETIERNRITTVHFVPSMLRLFLDAGEAERCGSLRRIICSGEALRPDLAQRCLESIPAELQNLYGPTEASIDVTYWKCEAARIKNTVPIGRPISNTQLYVLDENREPTPTGVPGELYLGGTGLARGYTNAPDLTAELFVPDPFGASGGRLYRTGDQVRHGSQGDLEFLGRRDAQVKLRGNRIELREIEWALRHIQGVDEAAVVLVSGDTGNPRLIAYVVAREPITGQRLREELKEHLPGPMIPSEFVLLEAMPLSLNGKIDQRALPVPHRERAANTMAPRNEIEEKLLRIWMEVLGLDGVGVEDNFFALGGHSLLAAQALLRVKEVFHVEVPLRQLFETPTIAAVAGAIKDLTAENQTKGRTVDEPKIKKLPRKSVAISRE